MVPYGSVIHHGVVSALKQPCIGTSLQRTTTTFRASCEHGVHVWCVKPPPVAVNISFRFLRRGSDAGQSWLPRIDFGGCCSKLRDSFVIQLPVEPIEPDSNETTTTGELGWMDRIVGVS